MTKSQGTPVPSLPARRNYKPEPAYTPTSELPFVFKGTRKQVRNNWHVPPTDDYALACDIGREYAAHFAQWLKDNPGMVGSNALGRIAAEIDFSDNSNAKGYWIGFFAHLERLIHATAQRIDVFSDIDSIGAHYSEIAAKRAAEKSALRATK